jgi:F0F1-type ATP synthase assembly protein I
MTTSEGTALSPNTDHGVDRMLTVAIQFVVAIAVWGTVGLVLDQILPTAPWLQFAGVTAGSLIGLVLVQRSATAPDPAGEGGRQAVGGRGSVGEGGRQAVGGRGFAGEGGHDHA